MSGRRASPTNWGAYRTYVSIRYSAGIYAEGAKGGTRRHGDSSMNRPEVRLLVGIPSMQSWDSEFGAALAMMCTHYSTHRLGNSTRQRLNLLVSRSSMLPQKRENILAEAIKKDATHLLFLDTDMTFPKDLVHRLYRRGKSFVAANCVTKKIPAEPLAVLHTGERLYTDPQDVGMVRVLQVGLAVALIEVAAVKDLEQPWFEMAWKPELDPPAYAGEDVTFCHKLNAAGIDVWIDQDVSKEIGHVGAFKYDHSVVGVLDDSKKGGEQDAA